MEQSSGDGPSHPSPQQTSHISPLESLPSEVFNRILYFVFDPASCATEETETKHISYRFDVALLLVNKAVHQLARSYLHHTLSWVRVDINLPSLPLVDPRWYGFRYITIPHAGIPKFQALIAMRCDLIPTQWRSTAQDCPEGRLRVKITFPQATTANQTDLTRWVVRLVGTTSFSVLVLGNDFPNFMRIVRMNDLAYSQRILPGAMISGTPATPGVHGMQYEIDVDAQKQYGPLLECFRNMHGTLHKCIITGANDKIADSIIQSIEHPTGSTTKRPAAWEVIRDVLWCKQRSDEHFIKGAHDLAYAQYIASTQLVKHCTITIRDEQFRDIQNRLLPGDFVGFTTWINARIAYVYGMGGEISWGLRYERDPGYSRGLANLIGRWVNNRGYHVLKQDYATLMIVMGLFAWMVEPVKDNFGPDMIIEAWTQYRGPTNNHMFPTLGLLAKIYETAVVYKLQLAIDDMQEPNAQQDPRLSAKFLKMIKELLHSHPRILPFKWGIREEQIPVGLYGSLGFLRKVKGAPEADTQREYMWGTMDPHPADRPNQVRYLM